MNRKIGGLWRDGYEYVWEFADEQKVEIAPDDIEVIQRGPLKV